ncbi:hypothetical protein TTHERM_01141580 (macronuclear) [Tetrahymena thermophila SB210]|uniref:Uncharacterized protein n=1 Tax=Tetrahymena thermophila (strain SB210) TaxID=312017 RepID=Q22AZ1_TETTS|nr:hypothetical protein TTHERM_01141580 [Tetrahymena thermophila SB210]EAR82467.2 hypothetical protein TTHERM_01141580 [Tetrahymena thermophila SB210]|eukprot:XP_001030130.2 hypothetical protein TTHERM_01141580 [Tetrahymena thermophila SB210]
MTDKISCSSIDMPNEVRKLREEEGYPHLLRAFVQQQLVTYVNKIKYKDAINGKMIERLKTSKPEKRFLVIFDDDDNQSLQI